MLYICNLVTLRVYVPTSPSLTAIPVPLSGTLMMCVLYIHTTMSNNPYVSNIIQQTGMTEREVQQSTSAITREFPCTIHGRYFATEADYLDELHEFLNGM